MGLISGSRIKDEAGGGVQIPAFLRDVREDLRWFF